VLARAIEEAGLPTVAIVLIKEHAQRVKPPRALWVPFPYGFALGKPGEPEFQYKVLTAALDLLSHSQAPVLAEFPDEVDAPPRLLQASVVRADPANRDGDPADEITALRGYYERWVTEHEGRTMVGLSGVPQRRFRGLVRYMQAFVDGADATYEQIPEEMGIGRFLRVAADDLKAFCLEARFCQRPDQEDNALHEWFWSKTAIGRLLVSVADRLAQEGDERNAQGIAR